MKIYLIAILFSSFIFPQSLITEYDVHDNCPDYFTNGYILSSQILFDHYVIVDSLNYSLLPKPLTDIHNIIKNAKLSKAELLSGVEGIVFILCEVDTLGNVSKSSILKGISHNIDHIIDSLCSLITFSPAKIKDSLVNANVGLKFKCFKTEKSDKSDILLDEIILQYGDCDPIAKRITFNSSLEAIYEENTDSCGQIIISDHRISIYKKATIDKNLYKKLSDFILSQCFLKWPGLFGQPMTHISTTTIKVKVNDSYKSVSAYSNEPISFWAIKNLILNISSMLKW